MASPSRPPPYTMTWPRSYVFGGPPSPTDPSLGEHLYWSYAGLAMAHAAVVQSAPKYTGVHYAIRNRVYRGLRDGTQQLGSFLDDERLKMILPQACAYCGEREWLSMDHVFARSQGGTDAPENIVWACRTCNSRKGSKDLLRWFNGRGEFPPLLLLRRYLKLTIVRATDTGVMAEPIASAAKMSLDPSLLVLTYPRPSTLRLWTAALPP